MIVFDTSIYIDALVPAKEKRNIDSYFIATSKLANSILISNDRIMVNNAKKYGIKAYYLIEEIDKVLRELR